MKKLSNVDKIVSQIKRYIDVAPEIAIMLGSGWGKVAELIEHPVVIPYASIKGLPKCRVVGHSGNFVFGKLAGKNVCLMQGRLHYYEGHGINDVVVLVSTMHALGAKKLIVTNAAGGINPSYNPGDVMIIQDHINMLGTNPLIGRTENDGSMRFVDMTNAYNPQYINILRSACSSNSIRCHVGTYLQTSGPNYETPAEVRAFKSLGADAVGMSTVCEVIMANYYGMQVAGLALITNMAAGIAQNKLSHEEVIKTAENSSDKLNNLIRDFISKI